MYYLIAKRHDCNPAGFTLIETMIAMMIIGLTIAAILAGNVAFTQSNAAGINISTAEFLIDEIRELSMSLPAVDPQTSTATFGPEADETSVAMYDDLDDFDGTGGTGINFCPPIDINRNAMANFAAFTQKITVENVSPADLTVVVADHGSDFFRVTVEILFGGKPICSCSWIRARL